MRSCSSIHFRYVVEKFLQTWKPHYSKLINFKTENYGSADEEAIDEYTLYQEEEIKDNTENYGRPGSIDHFNNGIENDKKFKELDQWNVGQNRKDFHDKDRKQESQEFKNTNKFSENFQRQASDINWNSIDTLIGNDNPAISDNDLSAMKNVVSQGFKLLSFYW